MKLLATRRLLRILRVVIRYRLDALLDGVGGVQADDVLAALKQQRRVPKVG